MASGKSQNASRNRLRVARLAAARARKLNSADRELMAIPKSDWEAAKRTEQLVKAALRDGVEAVAKRARRSERSIYRLLARYRLNPTLLAFLPRKRGVAAGSRRLNAEREVIIAEAVDRWLASREPQPIARAVEGARVLAKAAGLKPASRNAVVVRLMSRGGVSSKASGTKDRRNPDNIPNTRRALAIVQADHTPMDVIIVDEVHRLPIGRPWITIIFDVASRAVLGFHATLEAPSATSVALALSMACLPKEKWLKEVDAEFEWPMHGVPELLHLDNGSEFHSEALRRGCERYGIRLAYRPPGRPYTGGHIERYLGTLMRRIHGIPGTTMSNVMDRGSYQSEKRATLTLRELEAWLRLEIAGRYHHAIHRGIHMTPSAAWARATENRTLPTPKHPEEFALDFLPVVSRQISGSGFQLFHIRYWDPLLSSLFPVPQRLFVRYDPRNLSRVWVPIPGRGAYVPIPYADLRRPPISQYEQEAAIREIKATGRRTANEDTVFATVELQRKLIDRARKNTRARRTRERRPVSVANTSPPVVSSTGVDYSKPATPSPGEIWYP